MGVWASLLVTGIDVTNGYRLLFMLPLCLCIAVVYKTLRCRRLSDIPVAALVLWVTIVVGMYSVGVGLWALFTIMA